MALDQRFNQLKPSRFIIVRHPCLIPPVVVGLGELLGLIYRANKGQAGRAHAYIHLMEDPPRLVSNVEGTQLYVVGRNYRVTPRGIEG